MEIINETRYSTEDIKDLCAKLSETAESIGPLYAAQSGYATGNQSLPSQIRIEYYKPSEAKNWRGMTNYVYRSGWAESSRIGIVRPSAFNIAPLVALAQVADGATPKLPAEVVYQLALELARLTGGSYIMQSASWSKHWDWVKTFEVRYSARAKRGSKAKAKLVRDLLKLEALRALVEENEFAISREEIGILSKKRNLVKQKIQLKELKKSLNL